ncbi:hypothetical protein ACU686_10445 [Yinghuangia aomiensis]
MTGVKELAYVVYEAGDLADWERCFAVDLLGLQLAEKTDDELRLRLQRRQGRTAGWCAADPPTTWSQAATRSRTAPRFGALTARLAEAGVAVAEGDAALAAARRVDRIVDVRWTRSATRVELVVGFADADTPFRSDRLLGEFVTGTGGAGHQVLLSKGVAREDYLAFYQGLLGLSGSPTPSSRKSPRARSRT